MRPFQILRPALAAALTLALAACDAAGLSDNDASADAVTNEDAAVIAAQALALDPGGALDAVGAAVEAADEGAAPDPFCSVERTYDPATQAWTRVVACERGRPEGPFYARFGRTQTFQFFNDGVLQEDAETADALDFTIVDGYGERRTPFSSHTLIDIGGAFTITNLDQELVTANGTRTRSATDTLRTRRMERAMTYTMSLTFDDVRGPHFRQGWRWAEGGTVSGTMSGTSTLVGPRGQSRTREFERTFTITFGERGGEPVALVRVGDETFRADPTTGQLLGVE